MAILPLQTARVSNLLRTGVSQGQIARTRSALLRTQNELSTGRRLNVASDDPGDAAVVQQLQKTLEQRDAYLTNLQRAGSHLGEVDSTLGGLTDLLKEAQTIASANVGSDVPPEQREGAAAIVERLYSEALSLGNRQFEDVYLFGGDRATDRPFVPQNGGVQFVGSSRVLENVYDEATSLPFMVDGAEVFGAMSTRVEGATDLSPTLAGATRLADLRGAAGDGVRPGLVSIGNGTSAATVDLAGADTVGDVIDAINGAGLGGVTATIAPDGASIRLSGGATEDITVKEIGGGSTARDLGLLRTTGAGAGAPLDGEDVKPRVTLLTPLAHLRGGAGIDQAGGLKISNGAAAADVDVSGATTVEDLLNAINASGTHVRAEVNAGGDGINIFNPVQGTQMRIAEGGGRTAADLGVRSFTAANALSDLNGGRGVRTIDGVDFRVAASNGAAFDVDLGAGQTSVQGVIDAINAAATAAGVAVAADFATTGNGIRLTDNTAGGGALAVEPQNFSEAAKDLGLTEGAAAAGNMITGADVAPVASKGVFAELAALRDALRANDPAGITAAAEGLDDSAGRVARMRGQAGARLQEMESRQARIEDQNVATRALLSSLADTDFPSAVAEFQTLQTALQATMQTSAQMLNLSLMDFIG